MEQAANEIKRLRACINNLISVQALPAIWSGGQPPQIVGALLDMPPQMLGLDFAYVRLNDSTGGSPSRWPDSRRAETRPVRRKRSAGNFIFDGKSCIPRPALWLISRDAIA